MRLPCFARRRNSRKSGWIMGVSSQVAVFSFQFTEKRNLLLHYLRLASAGLLFGAQGGEHGAAHGRFGGALLRPNLPLSKALSDEHFDARDGGDAFPGGDLQELCLLGAVDHVHNQAAMQLAGRERRNAIVRMHANRGGVQDSVEGLRAQSSARHYFSTECAGEFPCGFFAARANGNCCAGTHQRKSGCPRRATRPEDQDAAASDAKFSLERAEHAEVIGVAAKERTVAANDHGVNGANFRSERIALLQIFENPLLVRMGDAESADSKFGNGGKKIAKIMHKEGEIDGVHMTRDKTCVVQ